MIWHGVVDDDDDDDDANTTRLWTGNLTVLVVKDDLVTRKDVEREFTTAIEVNGEKKKKKKRVRKAKEC